MKNISASKGGKNVVQFRRRWEIYGVGEVAGFDGKTAKFLIDKQYAVLLGEDSADPIPTDEDVDLEPENLAEAVRKRLAKEGTEPVEEISVEDMMEEGELRWWKRFW